MARAGARLDAYAHHPYPMRRGETPSSGGCAHRDTLTMATLERLLREVSRAFGRKRIWLSEYGYQTNPPDTWFGVSQADQARFLAEAALRAYRAPRVDRGRVRPGFGVRSYRLRVRIEGRWAWSGGEYATDSRGFFTRRLPVPGGALVQLVAGGLSGVPLRVW